MQNSNSPTKIAICLNWHCVENADKCQYKMLNITNHRRNVNQNHNETSYNPTTKKTKSDKCQ